MIFPPAGGGTVPEIRVQLRPFWATALVLAVLFLGPAARAGDDGFGAAPPSAPPSDKSHFTLFDPTPDSQLRDMDTDRPNVTNTPHTIDAGHWQIEVGILDYARARDETAGDGVRSDDFGFGQFNLRFGILNNVEINLAIAAYEIDRIRSASSEAVVRARGFGDTVVGGKLNLWGSEGSNRVGDTAFAIQPQFRFPTAHDGIGDGQFECSVAFPFLLSLPAGFHLGLQAGVAHEPASASAAYVTGFPASISLDRAIFGNLDVYLEYAGGFTTEKQVRPARTLDIGATYPLTRDIVLDAGLNFGVTRTANAIEVLTGISLRR